MSRDERPLERVAVGLWRNLVENPLATALAFVRSFSPSSLSKTSRHNPKPSEFNLLEVISWNYDEQQAGIDHVIATGEPKCSTEELELDNSGPGGPGPQIATFEEKLTQWIADYKRSDLSNNLALMLSEWLMSKHCIRELFETTLSTSQRHEIVTTGVEILLLVRAEGLSQLIASIVCLDSWWEGLMFQQMASKKPENAGEVSFKLLRSQAVVNKDPEKSENMGDSDEVKREWPRKCSCGMKHTIDLTEFPELRHLLFDFCLENLGRCNSRYIRAILSTIWGRQLAEEKQEKFLAGIKLHFPDTMEPMTLAMICMEVPSLLTPVFEMTLETEDLYRWCEYLASLIEQGSEKINSYLAKYADRILEKVLEMIQDMDVEEEYKCRDSMTKNTKPFSSSIIVSCLLPLWNGVDQHVLLNTIKYIMEDNILDLDTGQEIVYSDLMLEKLDDQNKKALMEHCLTGLGMGHEEPAEGTESPESSASEKDEPGFDSERGLYILTALLEMLFPRAEKEDLAIFSFITSLKTVEWILSVVIEGSFDHDYELLVCLGLLTYLSSSGEQPKILDSIRNFLHSLRKDPKKKELKETFYLACAEAKARVKKIRNKNNATSSNVSRGVQDWLSAFLSEEKEKLRERIFGESLKGRDIDVVSLVVSCSTGMPREIAATPTLEFFLEHSSPGNGIKLSPDQIATILPIAELLLTNGADPNASIRDGKSPLWKHIVDKDVISLLLKYGAKLGSCGPRFFSKVLKAGDNDVAEVLWLQGMSLDTAPQGDVVCKSLPPTVPSHFFSPAMWTPARHIKFPKWFRLTIETTLLCWRRQSLRFQHNQVLCYRSRSEVTQSQDYTNSEPQETARKRPRIGPPEANKRPEMPVSVPRDGAEPFHPVGVLPKCVLLSCICTLLSPAHFSVLYY